MDIEIKNRFNDNIIVVGKYEYEIAEYFAYIKMISDLIGAKYGKQNNKNV